MEVAGDDRGPNLASPNNRRRGALQLQSSETTEQGNQTFLRRQAFLRGQAVTGCSPRRLWRNTISGAARTPILLVLLVDLKQHLAPDNFF